jgi:NAD(P)-dependent dehydrogenase (short-subunit alcohol dehydrogenase family)
MDDTRRLAGRCALITGGARGQGASHAERLARDGARVLACDVLDPDGEATAARLRDDGLDVTYLHLDVTDPGDWATAIATARERFGRLDVLVNNAGVIHVTPLVEERLEDWNELLAVNLTGPLLGIQAAVPLLRERGGSIINVASIFGVRGAPGYVAYTASKGGLIALTKTAALELAPDGIRVNAICPGGVSTPMNEHEKEGGVIPQTPLGRRAHVAEISGAVAYLASDDASFVTGSELVVDGGFLAH